MGLPSRLAVAAKASEHVNASTPDAARAKAFKRGRRVGTCISFSLCFRSGTRAEHSPRAKRIVNIGKNGVNGQKNVRPPARLLGRRGGGGVRGPRRRGF